MDKSFLPSEKNGFYFKNISLLKEKGNLELVKKLDGIPFPKNVEIIKTKAGVPTLRVKKGSGQQVLLHSAYDPFREAKNFIRGYDLEDTLFLIVVGFGLGYHVKEIIDNYPWIKLVIVIEPQPSFFKLALSLLDLSPLFSSPRVKLIVEDSPLNIKGKLLPVGETFLTGKTSIVFHNPSFNLLDKRGDEVKKSIHDTIFWSRTNLTTNIAKGGTFQRNILTNIPQVISNPGIKNLFGKFKNKPAICVAAGPSLNKNVHLLKEVENKALIICVDAALRTLLEHQIEPHIVVSIDYGVGVRNLFDGVMERTENLFLAADPEVYPDVLSDFKGKKFIINIHKPIARWLNNFVEDKGFLEKGASVAHTAFSLARALGADPIILTGQDLCYPGGFTHAEGALPRKRIAIGIDKRTGRKYLLIRSNDGKWIGRDLVMVKDIYGRDIPTTMDMYSYLVYFERIISLTKAKCIDATEGGAKIEGTEIMTLREVIDKYCQEEFEVREILEEASRIREKVNLEELKEEMEKVIRRLKEINFYAGEGQKVIRRLQRELRQRYSNHQELKNLARESNQLEEKIMKVESYIRSFLEDEMYSHLYLAQRKANLRLDKLSKRKKLFNQVEKVGIFYDGVKKGTEKLINNFELSFAALCKLYS
ncbi:motility associated factor glycosyltransferase family protein [Candidatus Aerophobetes bacterium]|nr:motility associated factor glycosyltransferase family protein [Candidatus Aerophobetes bacterium]